MGNYSEKFDEAWNGYWSAGHDDTNLPSFWKCWFLANSWLMRSVIAPNEYNADIWQEFFTQTLEWEELGPRWIRWLQHFTLQFDNNSRSVLSQQCRRHKLADMTRDWASMLSLGSEELISLMNDGEDIEGKEDGDARILHGISLVLGTEFDETRFHLFAIKADVDYFHDQLFPTNPQTTRKDMAS